jgi:hypothetical protein
VVHPLDGDASDGAGGGVVSKYQVSVVYLYSLPVWRYTCMIFCPSAQLGVILKVEPATVSHVDATVVI